MNKIIHLFLISFFSLITYLSFSANISWKWGVSGDWNNSTNWTGEVVPGNNDYAIINAGANATITVSTNTVAVQGLTIYSSTVIVSGTLNLTQGASSSPVLYNRSTLNVNNGGIINISNSSQPGIQNQNATATITNEGTINISDISNNGIFIYSGSFVNGSTGIININNLTGGSGHGINTNSSFTNNGIINIGNTGAISARGIYNTSTFVNDGGTINIDHTSSQAFHNNGGIVDNTGNSNINIGLIAQCNHRGIENNGTFDNREGSSIHVGNVSLGAIFSAGGTFSNYGSYIHEPISSWGLNGNSGNNFINKSTGIIFSGKTFEGNCFINEGIINPGNSPGKIKIINKYVGNAGAKFTIEIGGTTPTTDYDQVNFQNAGVNADISNTELVISYINGFSPTGTESFDIIIGNGFTGTFSSITRPAAPTGYEWVDTYTASTYTASFQVPTPVELMSFTAIEKDGSVLLNWKTASETNNAGFELYKSKGADTWEIIAWIKGAGNSNEYTDYSFTDKKQIDGINYYRLKQIDRDGKCEYSEIISILLYRKTNDFSIYPNPASTTLNIRNNASEKNIKSTIIYDMFGNQIKTYYTRENTIDISQLGQGIYVLKIKTNNETYSEIFVVK